MQRKGRTYKIRFECVNEFMIVPAAVMQKLFVNKNIEKKTYISKAEIFPDGYMEYLIKVLNVNRHIPEFSYKYINENPIKETAIFEILLRQLGQMKIGEIYCFEKIKPVRFHNSLEGIEVIYAAEFLEINNHIKNHLTFE